VAPTACCRCQGRAASGFQFAEEQRRESSILRAVADRLVHGDVGVCDAAFDPTTLLTSLKDLLNVSVVGFKDKTVYCPPTQTVGSTVFNRKGEKIGILKKDFKCADDSTTDWRSLITNPNAVTVKK
jgi:hypothetical protein